VSWEKGGNGRIRSSNEERQISIGMKKKRVSGHKGNGGFFGGGGKKKNVFHQSAGGNRQMERNISVVKSGWLGLSTKENLSRPKKRSNGKSGRSRRGRGGREGQGERLMKRSPMPN